MINAAASGLGKNVFDHEAQQQADEHGSQQQAILIGMRHGAEQQYTQPLDGHAEANHQQSREQADEDGENKKEAIAARGGDMLYLRVGQLETMSPAQGRPAAAVARRRWKRGWWSDHSFCFVRSLRQLQQQRIIAGGRPAYFRGHNFCLSSPGVDSILQRRIAFQGLRVGRA